MEELQNADQEQLEEAFGKLIESDRSGYHYLVLTREQCRWATSELELSGRDKHHLNRIKEDYATRGNLPNEARVIVNVTIGNDEVAFYGGSCFAIGHLNLIAHEYLLKSVLVVEDIEADGGVYGVIFHEVAKITSNIPTVSFELVHGGGANTARVFRQQVEKGRIAVCIVDHDRMAPMDRRSNTAKSVINYHNRRNGNLGSNNQCYIGLACETVGREVENWIPYRLLRQLPNVSDQNGISDLDTLFLENLEEDVDNCFWLYFDIKKGLDGSQLMDKLESKGISETVVDWICQKIDCSKSELAERQIRGLGEGVIKGFLKDGEALGSFHQYVRSNDWQCMFGDYLEKLVWYFVAPRQNRT